MLAESSSRSTILRAASTEATSRATISRSRGLSLITARLKKLLRHFCETLSQDLQRCCLPRILQIVQVVESIFRVRHNHLFGNDQRAAAKFQHLAQRKQPARAAQYVGRGRCECKSAPATRRISRLAALADPRATV